MNINWVLSLNTNDNELVLAIGNPIESGVEEKYARPKVLLITQNLKCRKLSNLVLNIIRILSAFHVEPIRVDELQFSDYTRILMFCSLSILTPFRYDLALPYMKFTEHTRTDVVKTVHARLTTPIHRYKVSSPELQITYKYPDNILDFSIATLIAGLLSSATRQGYYVRLVAIHTLLILSYLAMKSKTTSYSEEIVKMLKLLIHDTVSWYVKHVNSIIEPEIAEYHYMIYRPTVLADLRVTYEAISSKIDEALEKERMLDVINDLALPEEGSDDDVEKVFGSMFRRIAIIGSSVKRIGKSFTHVATVATEQWSPLQVAIITEASHANKLTTLYTQNVLYQRFYEELFRREIIEKYSVKLEYPRVKYMFASATDAVYIDEVINTVLSDGVSLILAQGPVALALKMYVKGLSAGVESILI